MFFQSPSVFCLGKVNSGVTRLDLNTVWEEITSAISFEQAHIWVNVSNSNSDDINAPTPDLPFVTYIS